MFLISHWFKINVHLQWQKRQHSYSKTIGKSPHTYIVCQRLSAMQGLAECAMAKFLPFAPCEQNERHDLVCPHK